MTCKDCIYQCDWVNEPYETCESFKNKALYGYITNDKSAGVNQE